MSYRFQGTYPSERRQPAAPAIMSAMLLTFLVVSLVILFAGRLPNPPTPTPLAGPTYRDYVVPDRQLLSSYGFTLEGNVHLPIDRAIDLTVERGLPTR
ncbi:MAG: hypothetical protein AB4911_17450 [Oscillochloridaceae bacterium umkhey_bin13]